MKRMFLLTMHLVVYTQESSLKSLNLDGAFRLPLMAMNIRLIHFKSDNVMLSINLRKVCIVMVEYFDHCKLSASRKIYFNVKILRY